HVVHVPGAPLEHAAAAVLALRTGGRTPLAAGLDSASELIRRGRARDPRRRAIAVVLTDGRAPAATGAAARLGRTADAVHIVDTEEGAVRLGLARDLAVAAGATLIPLPAIRRPSVGRRAA
ncbi:MAG: ChlI component of cobalt chelatase involved in B12 biosynthesis / ChlD component of cobalt chelatase involved in B12 biosynthesis, partial [uncultured Solirubrobacteraceae bacterium]